MRLSRSGLESVSGLRDGWESRIGQHTLLCLIFCQRRLIRPALSSRTDRRLALHALVSAKIDGVPVFDTGATNLFTVVPTLTVPDRWIFPRIEGG